MLRLKFPRLNNSAVNQVWGPQKYSSVQIGHTTIFTWFCSSVEQRIKRRCFHNDSWLTMNAVWVCYAYLLLRSSRQLRLLIAYDVSMVGSRHACACGHSILIAHDLHADISLSDGHVWTCLSAASDATDMTRCVPASYSRFLMSAAIAVGSYAATMNSSQ